MRYKQKLADNGLNFYLSRDDFHVVLMDMMGDILHEWRVEFEDVYNGRCDEEGPLKFFERAHLFENGDILALSEWTGLLKLDKNSKLLWAYNPEGEGVCHHDFDVTENGNIYVLVRRELKGGDKLGIKGPVREDGIAILDAEGKEIQTVSLIECFLNSDYAAVLASVQNDYDIFHTNTLEILGGGGIDKIPLFKKGQVLISIRELSAVAVVDLEEKAVVWVLSGMWRFQHHPTLLPNGNILLFDNQGNNDRSKVMEFNPLTQEIVWAYRGDSTNNFFSASAGRNQRLPNGNTLITETETGKVFEVTPENEVVWEFLNPYRANPDKSEIAAISEMTRINPESISFLGKRGGD